MLEALESDAQTADFTAFHTTEQERRDWAPDYRPALDRSRLLDKPSKPHPILTALMDEALTRIILVSDGAVMALRERTTGSRSPGTPTSDLAAIVTELDRRYEKANTHRKRLLVIKDAQAIALRLRYAPRSEQRGTEEWKRAIANDSRPERIVAIEFKTSASTVRRIKKDAGTSGTRGRPKSTKS